MNKIVQIMMILVLTTLACTINLTFYPANTSPTPDQSVEFAAGKPTTSSGYWYHDPVENFPSSAIVDGKILELNCTIGVPQGNSYWLLPEKSKGWVQVDLLQEYQVVKVEWLNTHNGSCMDRATTSFHISISKSGEFAGEEVNIYTGHMKIDSSPKFGKILLSVPKNARFIRFYVDGYYKNGGGLNELRIFVIKSGSS